MNSLKIFSFLGATLLVLISYQNCAKLEARKFDSSIFDDSDDLIDGDQPNLPPVNEPPQPLPPYTEPNRPLEDDANLVVISSGHNFTEGVAYHGPSKTLFFSDLSNGNDRVFSLDLVSGASEVWLQQNFGSNGNIFDKNGRMYSAQSRDQRRIVRYDDLSSSANSIPLPNMVGAEGFNAPNDVELHSNGDLYFTDPTYNGEGDVPPVNFRGVLRIRPGGEIQPMITSGFNQPNGLTFSPDEDKLYVSDSEDNRLYVYDVDPDGVPSNQQLFFDTPPDQQGGGPIDGIDVDLAGNIYISGAERIRILSPQGVVLAEIPVGETTTNCTIGDSTLYISGRSNVYSIDIRIPQRPLR